MEIENKKRKTKGCRSIGINEHLLKIEGDYLYKWYLKVGQECLLQALR